MFSTNKNTNVRKFINEIGSECKNERKYYNTENNNNLSNDNIMK